MKRNITPLFFVQFNVDWSLVCIWQGKKTRKKKKENYNCYGQLGLKNNNNRGHYGNPSRCLIKSIASPTSLQTFCAGSIRSFSCPYIQTSFFVKEIKVKDLKKKKKKRFEFKPM